MNDRMTPVSFDKLVKWALSEYQKEKSIFGIPEGKFYRKKAGMPLALSGRLVENPIGPAAGPHTQLAQNIAAAYLAGARYFELKTVQTLDGEDLPVSKPCISAKDEGYNVEGSTELTVQEAYNEYVKAHFLLNILSREHCLGIENGFAFNMSVGYDLTGISSPKIDAFIENLKDASKTPVFQECRSILLENHSLFGRVDAAFINAISPAVSSSITLSTLHGCPREEIEKIAAYLLGDKKLNVFIKCNPTLLGYEFARKTLYGLGYDYLSFDDHHFVSDLQYGDAVPMLKRLQTMAKELKLDFGVKLTNTFPVRIENGELPGDEMYLSGRALYPLTVSLAAKLAESFDGSLPISYSGGADAWNLGGILETGIRPVTMATTLLKPGGYTRLKQLAEIADNAAHKPETAGVDVKKLQTLADGAAKEAAFQKEFRETENRKLRKALPLTDCFMAPCKTGCPIGQDAPEYIRLSGEGRYREAYELIVSKNPFPFTTGTICAHPCMKKCTRMDYDKPVGIRAAKLCAVENGYNPSAMTKNMTTKKGVRVAVIGGGPAGLSAAYFLAREGFAVTVFEKRERPGGVPAFVIPDFRLPGDALSRDLELIGRAGVTIRCGVSDEFSVDELKKDGYNYIFLAMGAWKAATSGFATDGYHVVDVMEFLEKYKKHGTDLVIGKTVAVIGAGNSAMDAARAAKRVPGVEKVTIVYRRTKKLAPADREELKLALEDGVEFLELLTPVSFKNGELRCQKLALGAPDASGRKNPVPLEGAFAELKADTVVTATGQRPDEGPLRYNGILLDKSGRVQVDPLTNETAIANVFAGGDLLRGPATIVEAIADGRKFADTVLKRENLTAVSVHPDVKFDSERQLMDIADKKGVLETSCGSGTGACLDCGSLCNLCVEVCPNRANVAVRVPGLRDRSQVVHIDELCNACGNCAAFCPYDGAPYKDKLTFYRSKADFDNGENPGFWVDPDDRRVEIRLGDRNLTDAVTAAGEASKLMADTKAVIQTVLDEYWYIL